MSTKMYICSFLVFVLLTSACSQKPKVETVAENTTASSSFIPITTTTTVFDSDLAWENFLTAWENNLKESPVLTEEDLKKTEQLLNLWEWDGDKYNLNQYLFEVQVNGLSCTRIYNSMGWALLEEVHPILNEYDISHTYICDDSGELYLFGAPFYYEGNWWIYHNFDFEWEGFNCESPCGSYAPNFAKKYIIESPVDLLNYQSNDSQSEIISDLKIEILNCPEDTVSIEIGETFEVKFSVQAGDFDVTSIFYYFELNDEYYSRLPLDKENHSEFFNFPTANEIIYSSTFVEKLADGDTYLVSIDVLDEDSFFSYDMCKVDF